MTRTRTAILSNSGAAAAAVAPRVARAMQYVRDMGLIGIEEHTSRGRWNLGYAIAGVAVALLALLTAAVLVVELAAASVAAPRLLAVHRWIATSVVLGVVGWGTVVVLVRRGERNRPAAHIACKR